MKVIRWGGRRHAGVSSGGAPTGGIPDSVDLLQTGGESVTRPSVARISLSRGAFRRSARATALAVVAMTTSVGLVAQATAAPVTGDGLLPGLDTVQGLTDATSGGGQAAPQTSELPLPTGDLLGGGAAPQQDGSSPTAGLPLLGDAMGQQQGGSPLGDLPLGTGGPSELAQPNNLQSPGAWVAEPDANGTQFGVMTNVATPGEKLEDGSTRFMADPSARNFNGSAGGWMGYEEYSPLCTVRGVGCVNWNFHHMQDDGPEGAGDDYLRTDGTSLGVAPCTAQNGKARWLSGLFTFNVKDAKSWKVALDARQTQLLVGDGHSAFGVDIVDDEGRIVTSALGPNGTFPLNKWSHMEAFFDGSEMAFGKNYRLSFWVDVVHAETALNIGNIDIDNIELIVDTEPGPAPTVPCTIDGSAPGHLDSLPPVGPPALRPPDLCPTTNQLGQTLAPVLDEVYCLLACTQLNGALDSLRGVFIIGDLETGQLLGYLAGKEAIPSIDPRDLLVYLKDGTLGKLAGYAILFVGNLVELVKEILSDPVGNVVRLVDGQLDNVRDLLNDPGRLLRLPVPWSIAELTWVLQTLLNPPGPSQTLLGGVVFRDNNKNGMLDAGEPGVPGVNVTLVDENGALTDETGKNYGTATTDEAGRYVFVDPQPRTEPSSYRLRFVLPDGMTFTQQHVPGSVHSNTSNPDPETGQTDRITVTRGQQDLEWHAGVLPADDGNGGTPDPDVDVVDVCADVPTINGQDAGTAPGPQFTGGEPITITLPITNCGEAPVDMSDLDVTSEEGDFTCTDANGDGTLDVGESAICTLNTTANPGTNVVEIDITFPDENGDLVTKQCIAYYTAIDGAKES
jgi:hypothetical protein